MIRQLRIKFVCVVMSVVVLMTVGMLSVVVHFTARNMEMQSLNMMQSIAGRPVQDAPPLERGQISLPYFAVEIDQRGAIYETGGYLELPEEQTLQQLVERAMASKTGSGELEEYDLRFLVDKSPMGHTVVFSDTTGEKLTIRSLALSCTGVFFAATASFLLISIRLSRWAVGPVEQAWKQQRQFVADASHELKTPLSVILANAELIQAEQLPAQERGKFAGNILSMCYQMRTLVEHMLEMARVDSGAETERFSKVDFSQLVRDAVLSVQLLYEAQGLVLEAEVADGIRVTGSERQLYQVLDVLLDNALKYSYPEGTVRVRLESGGRSCLLQVESPGQTLSPEELNQIFKRFYRTDKARTMNGSYGLGLAIAQGVVTAHKGKIWARSAAERNTFFVQLPAEEWGICRDK